MKNKTIQNILLILLAAILIIALYLSVGFFDYVNKMGVYSRNDDKNAEIEIEFQGSDVYCDYESVQIDGTTVLISEPGNYIFKGFCNDGQIKIDDVVQSKDSKGNYDDYKITLDGINLTSKKGSPFAIYNAEKLKMIVEGENTFTDAAEYSDTYANGAANACFYSKKGFEIDGPGSICVNGNYRHGISIRGTFCIKNANFVINAVSNAMDAKKGIEILDGTFVLNAGGDGINVSNNDDPGRGSLIIKNGNYQINANDDGIDTADELIIDNADMSISAKGLGLYAENAIKIENSQVDIAAQKRLYKTKGVVEIGDDCLSMRQLEEDN